MLRAEDGNRDVPSSSIRPARARRLYVQRMCVSRTSADGKLMAAAMGRLYQLLWNGPHVRAAEAFERRHSAHQSPGDRESVIPPEGANR
jgi:hypothetical protein